MKKKVIIAAYLGVIFFLCGCSEGNVSDATQPLENGSGKVTEASEGIEPRLDSEQAQFDFNDITLLYNGHIKSNYDYPRATGIISLDSSRGTDFYSCLTSDTSINAAASIQFVQSVDEGEGLFSGYKGSVYTLHNNTFSYQDTYPEIVEDEHYGYAVCDSFSCEISEDKRQEFVGAVLAIMGNPKEITVDMCYDAKRLTKTA